MTSSYTYSATLTFTRAHAKQICFRVKADLKRIQRFYGFPNDDSIQEFYEEVVELLTAGYLDRVWYGFVCDGKWIEPTLRYTAFELTDDSFGDDPGCIKPGANVEGAGFTSSLTLSQAWHRLSREDQEAFEKTLPFKRIVATEPGVDGYLQQDLSYSAGGRGLRRTKVRSWTS